MFKKLIIFVLVLGLVSIVTGFVLSNGDFENLKITLVYGNDFEYEHISKTGLEQLDKVTIDLDNNFINIYYSENEEYKIDYFNAEEDYINVTYNMGELKVYGREKYRFRLFNFWNKDNEYKPVNLYLPISFNKEVSVKIKSGKFETQNLNINKLNLEMTSGLIDIKNSVFNDLDIDLTSGKSILNNIVSNKLNTELTSGSIVYNNLDINIGNITATSGQVNIIDSKIQTLKTTHTSGEVNIINLNTNGLNSNLTSGEINITLLGNETEFNTILDVTSGNIYYKNVKYKNKFSSLGGEKNLNVTCTTGSITINFID